jgi:UDP-glucose:(heptosyl)LPS alpha-1,3-glucosyltransferase
VLIAGHVELAPRARLEIVRVRGPRRPASLRFLTFALFGALAALRRARGPIHTTGAIILHPVDVATVHFCHAFFQREVRVSRASRDSLPYHVNEQVFNRLALAAERLLYRPGSTRMLTPVSRGVGRELARFHPSMAPFIRTVPNGVDVDRFRPDARARAAVRAELGLDEDALIGLFVGGDWARKGLEYAIRALERSPGWQLVVAGAGDADRYAAIARSAGAGDRVHFVGPRTDVERLYAAADAFVLPTAYEAFPLAALEAAASALPIVASRVNGIEDLVVEGENGRLVPRDADAIGAALRELTESGIRRRLGAEARRTVAGRTWRRATEEHVAIYDALASEGANAR